MQRQWKKSPAGFSNAIPICSGTWFPYRKAGTEAQDAFCSPEKQNFVKLCPPCRPQFCRPAAERRLHRPSRQTAADREIYIYTAASRLLRPTYSAESRMPVQPASCFLPLYAPRQPFICRTSGEIPHSSAGSRRRRSSGGIPNISFSASSQCSAFPASLSTGGRFYGIPPGKKRILHGREAYGRSPFQI